MTPQQQSDPGQGVMKRKWPWIVGGIAIVGALVAAGIVAAIVISGSTGVISGSTGEGSTAQADGGPAAPAPAGEGVTVTYEVDGDADRGNVTYTADENLDLSQQNGVALPWTVEVPFPGDFSVALLALTAQSGEDGPGEITCRILRDDEVIAERTSSGPYAVVTCSEG